jgi:hypothetical protein
MIFVRIAASVCMIIVAVAMVAKVPLLSFATNAERLLRERFYLLVRCSAFSRTLAMI